jgi:hypothetical protein
VKYERTASFEADWRRLTAREQQLFRDAVIRIKRAYAGWRRIGGHQIFERP